MNSRANLLRKSFREKAKTVRGDVTEKFRKVPKWVRISRKIYHEYGLKHVCLIGLLVVYQFLGAGVFYLCEAGFDETREELWNRRIDENRTVFVQQIIPRLFNNSRYLFFLSENQTQEVFGMLSEMVNGYEKQLGIKYTDQKIKWDFWNAMLYAQTICTTIGYGHLYPSTMAGRIFTMIYAIFGIPLVLSILDDLGKLLTKCLKTPWWLLKCACRRMFRYCTKQTLSEIQKLDAEDRRDLEIFDLPIPIAISVVVAWIFICSATFCIWESDWDYFVAFYFFFISLSTIGLGDITPTKPKYLLMLFIYIIIGLSLVSMCINLIQAKLERTYEAGRIIDNPYQAKNNVKRRGSSLGIFRSSSSMHSLTRESIKHLLESRRSCSKSAQTVLSFPCADYSSKNIYRSISKNASRYRFLPRTLSIDDVMRMVDTEDGDILILTDLVRDESTLSQLSRTSNDLSNDESNSQIVVSKSFDVNFDTKPHLEEHLEQIEEIEDRIALSSLSSCVQFRSRLSLIPENVPSLLEEVDESSSQLQNNSNSPIHKY